MEEYDEGALTRLHDVESSAVGGDLAMGPGT
jgi:hypothetical protein